MTAALRHVREPQSPARFLRLAKILPLGGCVDASFHKFVDTLRTWFGTAR